MKNQSAPFSYAFDETAGPAVKDILLTIPSRWGRMPPLSRAVVVEAGKLLQHHNLLLEGAHQAKAGRTIGLIGGSRWGSFSTDRTFAETMEDDIAFASPAVFGYTLANIPLAEAANHFGLIGPVYAIIDHQDPMKKAIDTARRLLHAQKDLDIMLACEFDAYYRANNREQISVTFTIVGNHD